MSRLHMLDALFVGRGLEYRDERYITLRRLNGLNAKDGQQLYLCMKMVDEFPASTYVVPGPVDPELLITLDG